MSNKDFTPVKTYWGIMYLHKSRRVWFNWCKWKQHYNVYNTSRSYRVADPWMHDAIVLASVKSKDEAIKVCVDRDTLMTSLENRTFKYT